MKSRGSCVFVGGPIQNAVGGDGCFHGPTRSTVELVIESLTLDGHAVLSAHVHENFGELDVRGMSREVCLRDFGWMRQCDLFVAVLPLDELQNVIHSSGTAIELGWASALGRPVVLVCDPAPKYSHLILGLHAVTRTIALDINRSDLGEALREAVAMLLSTRATPLQVEHSDSGAQVFS